MLLTIKIKKHFQMSMSVPRDHMAAVLMLCASIPRDPITARVNLDTLEMDEHAKVNLTKVLHYFVKRKKRKYSQ